MGINSDSVRTFLVYDPTLVKEDKVFLEWLWREGFKFGGHHGIYDGAPWLNINLSLKLYAYGMPGIQVSAPIGNHAITTKEFRTIYGIYKKYEGKGLFLFHEKRFELRDDELEDCIEDDDIGEE